MKTIMLILCLLGNIPLLWAQDDPVLLVPGNIQQAYAKGTRAADGRPGPAYWQNRADYTIRVTLAPPDRTITGRETILYYNQSPDTLKQLVIRLYQDVNREGNPRDFFVKKENLHQGVRITDLVIDGKKIPAAGDPAVKREKTNMFVRLPAGVAPHTTVRMEIGWQFPLALTSGDRFGAFDSTSFFLAYWYPQVAVYDDIDGWDQFNYHGIQEFYNDFNDYDVSVTVPEGFVVWATGRLQNPEEVLTGKFLQRYRQAFDDTALIHVITGEDLKAGRITAANAVNTWHFRAEDVNDFAFGTSDHYVWDLTGMPAENRPGGRILVGAAYREGTKFLAGVTALQKRTIRYFSDEMPGVAFPFPSFTLFQLSGGMEYPMMNSQGELPNRVYYVFTATHELAHSYFPMLVGTNERKYAWMDEAWAMYLPAELQKRELGGYDLIPRLHAMFYTPFVGTFFDVPPMIPSIIYGTDVFSEYRYVTYARPFQAYNLLTEMLGEERFRTALQEYIRRWQRKHPMPYDFFNTFNDVLGENLNWFWKPWFFEISYPDLALGGVEKDRDSIRVTVVNKGGLPLPVDLIVTYRDGTTQKFGRSMRVWKRGEKKVVVSLPAGKPVEKITLGDKRIPDIDTSDNHWSAEKEN